MFEKEQLQGEFEVVSVVEEWGEIIVHNCLFHADLVRMYVHHSGFCFPRAFAAPSSNEDVYAECGWPLVSHALSGQLGTLFMFGQTGSGKTYTMSATMELAARDIFSAIGSRDEVAVRLKAFEVAGKKCFDLLPRQRTELKLLHDQSGRTNIVGAVEAPVSSADECLRLLREALGRRATAVHARNDESSRSHCVCVLDLLAVGGSLILVDCAGTERRQDTDQHSHERMKESAEINSTLHVLKECIRYRCKQQYAAQQAAKIGSEGHDEDEQHHVHVPYRDSQLTRVLHESFTRQGSYLAAIGTVAPSSMDAEHTMSTLKTLQLLMSESGQSDAPNFEQRVDIDPKALLKSSMLKRSFLARDQSRMSPPRVGVRPSAKDANSVSAPQQRSEQRGPEGERASGSSTPPTAHLTAPPNMPLLEVPQPSWLVLRAETPKSERPAAKLELPAAVNILEESPKHRPLRSLAAIAYQQQESFHCDDCIPKTNRSQKENDQHVAQHECEDSMLVINRLQLQVRQLEESLREVTRPAAESSGLAAELEEMRCRCLVAERSAQDWQMRAVAAEQRIEEFESRQAIADRRAEDLENLFRGEQELRRRTHNQLLDLKGQIRVFCRVRPPLLREQGEDSSAMRRDMFTVEVNKAMTGYDGIQKSERKAFPFDAVFGPSAQQDEVFREVEDLVQSSMDGYNVTILAYGQTGAGKTYTMYGGPGEQRGIAGRTIEAIFNTVTRDAGKYDIVVQASMIELYLAHLRDLCSGESVDLRNIRLSDGIGSVRLEGAKQILVRNADELTQVVTTGLQNRVTRSTNMNDDSSRSHILLMITVEVTDRASGNTWSGKITLVDLAGSERIGKSGAVGDCQKEAIEINKALTALGDVIESLTRSPGRTPVSVPYRNHKLTQLLSDSLGGTAKTLMFVNISPARSEVDETLNSLAYASRARSIQNEVRFPQARIPRRSEDDHNHRRSQSPMVRAASPMIRRRSQSSVPSEAPRMPTPGREDTRRPS